LLPKKRLLPPISYQRDSLNSGIQLRQEWENLAPADVRKGSSELDLPIAVALLASYGMVPEVVVQSALFSVELSLDGNCRPISGILPMTITVREHGLTEFQVAPVQCGGEFHLTTFLFLYTS